MSTLRSLVGPCALGVLVALACILCASTYSVFGHTWDEPEHLAAGIALLDKGEYPYDAQHPPLARIAMALGPYLAGAHSYGNRGPSGEQEGREILYRSGHYDEYLTLARVGMLPFLVLLLLATWAWTRHAFGRTEAFLATAFLICIPPVIGHAAVAALDVPMAATTMLAMYTLARWFETPTVRTALVVGSATGIAFGTKLSAIPFLGIVVVAWTIAAGWPRRPATDSVSSSAGADEELFSRRTLGHIGIAAGIALLTMIACYGFQPLRIVDSFKALLQHNSAGHLSYFMGELRRTGWWDFYLVALGVKTPLPTLLLGMAGLSWLVWRAWRERRWSLAAPSLAFAAILIFASAYSHINIGVRHVIVLFPLLAMGAAIAVVQCWRRCNSVAAKAALVVLAIWQIVGAVRAHPDDLAYFNELAGTHPERLLVDSDLDWGQDMRRLENELKARGVSDFGLIYRGSADLLREDLPHYRLLWPKDRATGWIAVSLLAKLTAESDGGYKWLDAYQPVMRIGKSIDLYYIEK